jgi:hypothetical protein
MLMFTENGFDLHGADHDTVSARFCTMKHEETGVVVKLIANTFFGTKIELVEDESGYIL